MIDRASFSGMVLFCLRKKSKSFPSQYSRTVQKEFVSISKTSNNFTMPIVKRKKRRDHYSIQSFRNEKKSKTHVYVPNVYEYYILLKRV